MRLAFTVLLALTLSTAAAAQSKGSARGSSRGHSPAVAPWASMTSTLPPIGLGLTPIGLAPPSPSPFKGQGTRFDRFGNRSHFGKDRFPSVVYVLPPFYPGFFAPYTDVFSPVASSPMPGMTPLNYSPPVDPPAPPPPPPLPAAGWLRLDLGGPSAGAQLFVDGYFVGTIDDVSGQVWLDVGAHSIAVRSPGYKPLEFDVKIVADRSITYRGTLERIDGTTTRVETAPASSSAPSTIYFIPGCYLGNVAPKQAALPASCDIAKLSTYKP